MKISIFSLVGAALLLVGASAVTIDDAGILAGIMQQTSIQKHSASSLASDEFSKVLAQVDLKGNTPKDGTWRVIDEAGQLAVVQDGGSPGSSIAAEGTWHDTLHSTGWSSLRMKIASDESLPATKQMYAAGFLEGFLTAQRIKEFHKNAASLLKNDEDKYGSLANIKDVFTKGIRLIQQQGNWNTDAPLAHTHEPEIDAKNNDAKWWQQASYLLYQVWGVKDGYAAVQKNNPGWPVLDLLDLFILNADGSMPEMMQAYSPDEMAYRKAAKERGDALLSVGKGYGKRIAGGLRGQSKLQGGEGVFVQRDESESVLVDGLSFMEVVNRYTNKLKKVGHCSALVRLTDNNADLLMAHATWEPFTEMTRIYKYYDFALPGAEARNIGFSSYPGAVSSTDDWYVMDTKVAVTETTLPILDDSAYDYVKDEAHTPDFMRIMISNRLAKSAADWVKTFKESGGQGNPGTYNSHWMVLDFNKFTPNRALPEKTFYVLEQVPGVITYEDQSETLNTKRYWASYNRAWYDDVRQRSGDAAAEHKYSTLGNLLLSEVFSKDKNPRAKVFSEVVRNTNDLEAMRATMQATRYPTDRAPNASEVEYAIAARFDLLTTNAEPNGGTDTKIVNKCLMDQLASDAISGPEHLNLPAFSWTDATGKDKFPGWSHEGLPDKWEFDWQRMTPAGAGAAPATC